MFKGSFRRPYAREAAAHRAQYGAGQLLAWLRLEHSFVPLCISKLPLPVRLGVRDHRQQVNKIKYIAEGPEEARAEASLNQKKAKRHQ